MQGAVFDFLGVEIIERWADYNRLGASVLRGLSDEDCEVIRALNGERRDVLIDSKTEPYRVVYAAALQRTLAGFEDQGLSQSEAMEFLLEGVN